MLKTPYLPIIAAAVCCSLGVAGAYADAACPPDDYACHQSVCSSRHDAASCRDAADMAYLGIGAAQNLPSAMKFYAAACAAGHLPSCEDIGSAHYAGLHGFRKNLQKAISYLEKACSGSVPHACLVLAQAQEEYGKSALKGKERSQMYAAAMSSLSRACDLDFYAACAVAGIQYDMGRIVRQDFKKANALYEKACSADIGLACGNLGISYLRGSGVRQNLKKCFEYLNKGCMLGIDNACANYKELRKQQRSGVDFRQYVGGEVSWTESRTE